ncbi:hypothetical protein C9374_009447 [Naegleria lovaniensis]|uniref:Pentapeptide repeat-containing protein n=1 Tax=Naegleria lovaniensis TaxID=51637 RepID=A0AA88GXL6_NAELO|nr:uncharacterized protein C9374_009447 [Naegleria lovaniensis]KAG2392870.1 hypothetical protein C9374_009447 [Naegleria lovaniensis]
MEDCDFSDATGMDSFWNALLDIIVKACKLSNTTCVISHHKYLVTSKRYEKSCFTNVDFKDIPGKLQECTLDNCKFEFERQPKTSLTGSKFQKIDFSKCTFSDCKFKNIQWNKNDVLANSFARCEFSECNFRNADLRDEVFSQCTFTNCQFWNCLMTTWLYQKISPSSRVQTDPVLPFGKQTTKRPFVVKVTSPNSVQELSREEIDEWEKSTNLIDDTFYDSVEELSQEEIEE